MIMVRSVTVKSDERALVTRNGRLERVLGPGLHRFVDPLRALTIETHTVVRGEMSADRYAVLKAALPQVADEMLVAVETRAGEVAIVSLDGRPTHVLGPYQVRVYWKVATRVDVERIDVASNPQVEARHLAMLERAGARGAPYVAETVVENHEAGLLHGRGPARRAAQRRTARVLDGRPQGCGARGSTCGRRRWRSPRRRC